MKNSEEYNIIPEKIESAHSRFIEASVVFTTCKITNELTWCIRTDTSEGEYGYVDISIKYINDCLEKIKK